MKKRLFCLFLCLLTVLSVVLTSCSDKTEDEATDAIADEASESAVTLTMWIVSEDKVSDAAAAAVSEAINAITKSKFKTQLVLKYLTEDEYESTLRSTITAYEEAKKNQGVVETEAVETETGDVAVTDETETNEFGMSVIKYPELIANQVDIIYVKGEKMYTSFIANEWLSELDTELSSSSKKIKEYVSTTLLSAAKYNGTTYAIPNNRVIGEYTYMLLNKELMAKYAQDAYAKLDMIDGFYDDDLYSFLNLVHMFEPNVIPLDLNEEFNYQFYLDMLAHYWNIDSKDYSIKLGEFSVFGYYYDNIEDLTRGSTILGYNSLFEDEDFVEDYLQLNRFRMDDYFGDATAENKTAAVKFVKGTYADLAEYNDEYYSVIVEYPTASSADIYDNMFGVCKYSKSVSRSMEIITYLNTNADFRNLLQYGIEGTHYEVNTDEHGNFVSIKRLTDDYNMTLDATGNMFIAYPDTEADMSADVWDSGKIQNRSSLVDPLLGLDFAEYSATTGEATAAPTVDSKTGYTLSYTTGYSVDVVGQNEVLAKWISDCDKAGKGIYVLETAVTEGQYKTANFYVYNNNLDKNASFAVEEIAKIETGTDSKGNETQTQTGVNLVLTYNDASGKSDTNGYELSVLSFYTKKNYEYVLTAKVNDTDAAVNLQQMNNLVSFDFLNTNRYTVEVFNNLSKTEIIKNEAVYSWVTGITVPTKATTYIKIYEPTEAVNGKKEYTYVIYRAGLKYVTSLDIQPTGNNGSLNIAFNFTHDEEDQTESADSKYLICYVRVTVDEAIVPTYSVTLNGADETSATKANASTFDVDPDFTICGNLDTELVKYLETLNTTMTAFLEGQFSAIKTKYDEKVAGLTGSAEEIKAAKKVALEKAMEEFAAAVAEVSALLTTEDVTPVYSTESMPLIYASGILVDNKLILDDPTTGSEETAEKSATALRLLNRYVRSAVSKDAVKIMTTDDEGKEVEAYYGGDSETGEAYVYFASPYGIYYSWLEKYGFLPKTK